MTIIITVANIYIIIIVVLYSPADFTLTLLITAKDVLSRYYYFNAIDVNIYLFFERERGKRNFHVRETRQLPSVHTQLELRIKPATPVCAP